MVSELLAQLVEVASVTASGRQLRAPVKVPRPKHLTAGPRRDAPEDNVVPIDGYAKAVDVLARSRPKRGR